MEKITLKNAEGEVFTFTGRPMVSKYAPMWHTNHYCRVNLYQTAHDKRGIHSEEPSFVLSVETEPGKHEIEKFRDAWQLMKFLQDCYTSLDHPLKNEALEIGRLAGANNGDCNEFYDSMILKFLKKRRLARERAEVEREQIALGEKERAAEQAAEERAVEERIQAEAAARSEGFMAHPNLERLGIY